MVEGGCHCGAIRFRVDAEVTGVIECNCSICRKKGLLHWIVPKAAFELESGDDELTTYTFNTHTAKHHFCSVCGVQSFYLPRSHPDCVDVNVRCLDDVEMADLDITPFDGENWEDNVAAIGGRDGGESTETRVVTCPYCLESVELYVDPETSGSFVEDCEVCCRPWHITVVRDSDDGFDLSVSRAQ